eukprot:scaffold123027_cov22-Tisochrysis_lutea.AAC.3
MPQAAAIGLHVHHQEAALHRLGHLLRVEPRHRDCRPGRGGALKKMEPRQLQCASTEPHAYEHA